MTISHTRADEVEGREPTPAMIAAAWGAWRVRHPTLRLGPGPGFREAIKAALLADDRAAQAEAEVARLTAAVKLLLPFADYAAGEGLAFVPSPDEPEMDAADICTAVAEALNIELGGPDYMTFAARTALEAPHADGSGGADDGR